MSSQSLARIVHQLIVYVGELQHHLLKVFQANCQDVAAVSGTHCEFSTHIILILVQGPFKILIIFEKGFVVSEVYVSKEISLIYLDVYMIGVLWKNIASFSFNQEIYYREVVVKLILSLTLGYCLIVFVNEVICLNVHGLEQSSNPHNKALVLIIEELNI